MRKAVTGATFAARRGRHVRGQECRCREHERGADERHGIGGADLVEKAAEQSGDSQCQHDSEHQPGRRDGHAFAQHEPERAGRGGAERLADTDLTRALGHRVRLHAIDPDNREEQSQSPEGAEDGGSDPDDPQART